MGGRTPPEQVTWKVGGKPGRGVTQPTCPPALRDPPGTRRLQSMDLGPLGVVVASAEGPTWPGRNTLGLAQLNEAKCLGMPSPTDFSHGFYTPKMRTQHNHQWLMLLGACFFLFPPLLAFFCLTAKYVALPQKNCGFGTEDVFFQQQLVVWGHPGNQTNGWSYLEDHPSY